MLIEQYSKLKQSGAQYKKIYVLYMNVVFLYRNWREKKN